MEYYDSISRQAAIDAIGSYILSFTAIDRNYYEGLRDAKKLLYSVQSAEPKLDKKDMPEQGDSAKFGVKTGKTCADCISRQAAVDALDAIASELHERKRLDEEYIASWCAEVIEGLPTVDVVPAVPGVWRDGYRVQTCSVCKGKGKKSWKFCPYCGADMRGGKQDERPD